MKRKKRGMSLIELLTAAAIFSAASLVLVVILGYGVKSWKQVEGRYGSERDLRHAVLALNDSVRNTDISTVSCNVDGNIAWIAMKSAVYGQTTPSAENVGLSEANLTVKNDVFTQKVKPDWNSYVIYYVLAPRSAEEKALVGQEHCQCENVDLCPHKVLLRRVVPFTALSQGDKTEIENLPDGNYLPPSKVNGYLRFPQTNDKEVEIIARNLIKMDVKFFETYSGEGKVYFGFSEPEVSRAYPVDSTDCSPGTVYYALQCFKAFEGERSTNVAEWKSVPMRYVLEIQQSIVPLNTEPVSSEKQYFDSPAWQKD